MPDVDGAHGFLTALLPLHTEPCARADGTITSPAHAVRELLAAWPTAQHSPVCAASGLQSPFARSPSTHLARLAVIDQPAFNGRDPQDAILTALNVGRPLTADPPVDRLERPYVLFCADFDRGEDAAAPVRDYLLDLWGRMAPEWRALLAHCEGWPAGGGGDGGADGFADYVAQCQVETTMPFNDYVVSPASGTGGAPLSAPLGAAFLTLVGVLLLVRALTGALPEILAWSLAGLVAAIAAIAVAVLVIDRTARRPSPWIEGQDLPTVLKALDLQARFTRFAIDHQGASGGELQAAFLIFLDEARPADLARPTQPPGVVPQGIVRA